jgi:hypothetical protein
VVVLAHVSALTDGADAAVVVGPAAARYDHDAADAELTRRRTRQTEAGSRVTALTAQRDADARLRAELLAFDAELPDGGVPTVEARYADALAARATTGAEEERARAVVASLNNRFNDLRDRAEELRSALQRDESAWPRVASLVRVFELWSPVAGAGESTGHGHDHGEVDHGFVVCG